MYSTPKQTDNKRHRYEPFPTDALPEPIRGFVSAGAKAIGCDASYLALPVLTVLAAAIGNARRLRIKRSWEACSIIWAAVVGESGTSKTPPFKLAMKPILARQGEALRQFDEAFEEYQLRLQEYERELTDWRRLKRNERAGLEPPTKPDPPEAHRCIVSDATVESLAPLLLANPRGLLLARDELSGWIGSFDRYSGGKGGGDAANWLSMFNAGSITVDRKTGDKKTIFVPSASVSICGGIQPAVLQRSFGREHCESGLAARFLLAYPPAKAKRWTEADVSQKVEEDYAAIIERLNELQMEVDPKSPAGAPEYRPGIVDFTPEAKELWKEYYNQHAGEQIKVHGDLGAAWSKLEEYPARLALVIHLVRWAAGDESLESAMGLDVQSLQAGIRLVTWFKGEARRVYGMFSESEAEQEERRLLEWIDRQGGEVSTRDVQQGCRWLKESGDAEAALKKLAEAGHGSWETIPPGPNGGRPARVFRLSTTSTSTEPH